MAPGSDNEQVLDSDIVSLKEGEMWGRRIPNVDSLLDGNGSLDVKFIIYYFNLYSFHEQVIKCSIQLLKKVNWHFY